MIQYDQYDIQEIEEALKQFTGEHGKIVLSINSNRIVTICSEALIKHKKELKMKQNEV